MQLLKNHFVEPLVHRRALDLADHILGESIGQQRPSEFAAQSSAQKIENLVLLELSDRRAVSALDVVSIDLELRLCIHGSIRREEQVLVELSGIGQERPLPNEN